MIGVPNKIGEELRTKGPLGGGGFRNGLIHAQNVATGRVQVQFPDRDNLVSHWLPILVLWSQNNKEFHIPDIGEQVACLMDACDEDGVVLGAIYSTADGVPDEADADVSVTHYKDGAVISYDRALHALSAILPTGATALLRVPGGVVNVIADHVNVESNDVKIGESPVNTVMLDTIIAKFNAHTHTGVQNGDSISGIPDPTQFFVLGTDNAPHVKAL